MDIATFRLHRPRDCLVKSQLIYNLNVVKIPYIILKPEPTVQYFFCFTCPSCCSYLIIYESRNPMVTLNVFTLKDAGLAWTFLKTE